MHLAELASKHASVIVKLDIAIEQLKAWNDELQCDPSMAAAMQAVFQARVDKVAASESTEACQAALDEDDHETEHFRCKALLAAASDAHIAYDTRVRDVTTAAASCYGVWENVRSLQVLDNRLRDAKIRYNSLDVRVLPAYVVAVYPQCTATSLVVPRPPFLISALPSTQRAVDAVQELCFTFLHADIVRPMVNVTNGASMLRHFAAVVGSVEVDIQNAEAALLTALREQGSSILEPGRVPVTDTEDPMDSP